jgi:Mn2+/Fe2+ NRAMP family transporter
MDSQQNQSSGVADLVHGLPMFTAADPQALATEKTELAALEGKPLLSRWRWYLAKSGPGWLQSALTLGGGSAMASLFLGAYFQYNLLWIQPLAMILGIIMLATMSYQTLSTGVRPFDSLRQYISPTLAWTWAVASLVATVVWHFPQYGLAAGMVSDMLSAATGWTPKGTAQTAQLLGIAGIVLVISTAITWNYGSGHKGIRLYEKSLKVLVWAIVISFAIVIARVTIQGRIEWGRVLRGFLPLYIPTDSMGVTTLMAGFGAAIGINMTFLFPYTLLARGWGREYRELSRFDLVTGMAIPYILATSLMVIAAGCTIYTTLENFTASDIPDTTALAEKLTTEDAGPSRRLSQMLDADTKATLKEIAETKTAEQYQQKIVVAALNKVLTMRDFYRSEDFEGIELPKNSAEILERDRSALSDKEIRLLNRQAIDASLPKLIKPVQLQLSPIKAAGMIEAAGVGKTFSRFVFGLGVLGMALSTITLHMLVAGFAFCEIFRIEPGGWKYKLACLIPAPALLGAVWWKYMGPWIAVPASAICGLMLPIAYIAFFVLNNKKSYLAADKPSGPKAVVWNIAMLVAIAVSIASASYYLYTLF